MFWCQKCSAAGCDCDGAANVIVLVVVELGAVAVVVLGGGAGVFCVVAGLDEPIKISGIGSHHQNHGP